MLALGVDVAEARKGLDVVALDAHRAVVASVGRATPADVAALVFELRPDVVCIDSPSGWSAPGARTRTAERALRALGITAFSTPNDPGDHPFYRWMRCGFAVFEAVADTHPLCRGLPPHGTAAEVFPAGTAAILGGRRTGSKVAHRRGVLAAQGVTGLLPNADRVDAALCALTGLHALEGRCIALGDPAEGVVLVPDSTRVSGSALGTRT